ncbi:pyridoxamine 5'-phosphate oxidase family protein [Caulobacter hibisci]|uniref:Pyridoxamine 5'-phosphate oxidase family protein n=1 Tax=Caulobacter hibisci TaxID=2035993 RepID=A0ABS0SZ60_9CAUL|nr:pyridoxamine 5'-phosphate oxidase family protein [Caulobacter hibisci]MBI1684889.1 pyridoxamine 5'-phosphate oxidase family protein [Caulobacter hibisci]
MPTDSLSCSDGEAALISPEQRRRIDAVLDDNQVMTLATNRPDGWPQATHVNYLHDGGALYFVVARESQKLANVQRDGRVSITIGGAGRSRAIGLSMAAMVTEVTDVGRISQLNTLLWSTPAGAAFSPHPAANSIAVLKAEPRIVSLVDYAKPPGQSQTVVMEASQTSSALSAHA